MRFATKEYQDAVEWMFDQGASPQQLIKMNPDWNPDAVMGEWDAYKQKIGSTSKPLPPTETVGMAGDDSPPARMQDFGQLSDDFQQATPEGQVVARINADKALQQSSSWQNQMPQEENQIPPTANLESEGVGIQAESVALGQMRGTINLSDQNAVNQYNQRLNKLKDRVQLFGEDVKQGVPGMGGPAPNATAPASMDSGSDWVRNIEPAYDTSKLTPGEMASVDNVLSGGMSPKQAQQEMASWTSGQINYAREQQHVFKLSEGNMRVPLEAGFSAVTTGLTAPLFAELEGAYGGTRLGMLGVKALEATFGARGMAAAAAVDTFGNLGVAGLNNLLSQPGGYDDTIDQGLKSHPFAANFFKDLPRAIVGTPVAMYGFKAAIVRDPKDAAEGIIQPVLHPMQTFQKNPAATILMIGLLGRDGLAAIKDYRIKGAFTKAFQLRDAGDIDGAMAQIEKGLEFSKGYQDMGSTDKLNTLDQIRQHFESTSGNGDIYSMAPEQLPTESALANTALQTGAATSDIVNRAKLSRDRIINLAEIGESGATGSMPEGAIPYQPTAIDSMVSPEANPSKLQTQEMIEGARPFSRVAEVPETGVPTETPPNAPVEHPMQPETPLAPQERPADAQMKAHADIVDALVKARDEGDWRSVDDLKQKTLQPIFDDVQQRYQLTDDEMKEVTDAGMAAAREVPRKRVGATTPTPVADGTVELWERPLDKPLAEHTDEELQALKDSETARYDATAPGDVFGRMKIESNIQRIASEQYRRSDALTIQKEREAAPPPKEKLVPEGPKGEVTQAVLDAIAGGHQFRDDIIQAVQAGDPRFGTGEITGSLTLNTMMGKVKDLGGGKFELTEKPSAEPKPAPEPEIAPVLVGADSNAVTPPEPPPANAADDAYVAEPKPRTPADPQPKERPLTEGEAKALEEGKKGTNQHRSRKYSETDAWHLGRHIQQEGIEGEVRRGKRNEWHVGDSTFRVQEKNIIEDVPKEPAQDYTPGENAIDQDAVNEALRQAKHGTKPASGISQADIRKGYTPEQREYIVQAMKELARNVVADPRPDESVAVKVPDDGTIEVKQTPEAVGRVLTVFGEKPTTSEGRTSPGGKKIATFATGYDPDKDPVGVGKLSDGTPVWGGSRLIEVGEPPHTGGAGTYDLKAGAADKFLSAGHEPGLEVVGSIDDNTGNSGRAVTKNATRVVLRDADGKAHGINGDAYRYITKKYPGGDWHRLAGYSDDMFAYVHDEKTVAVVAGLDPKTFSSWGLPTKDHPAPSIEAARSLPPGAEASTAPTPENATEDRTANPAGKGVSERDVVKLLVDATGQPHRSGRLGRVSRWVGGFFKVGNGGGVSRARNIYDVATAAHEIGHGLNERFGWWKEPEFQRELAKFGDPSKLGIMSSWDGVTPSQLFREGVAEYVRHWIQNPELAGSEAPKFTREFERILDANGMTPKFREARERWQNYLKQDPVAKIQANTDYTGEVERDAHSRGMVNILGRNLEYHGFRTDFIDNLFPIRQAEEEITGKRVEDVDPSKAGYIRLRNSRGATEIANDLVYKGKPGVCKGYADILQGSEDTTPGFSDFEAYGRLRSLRMWDELGRKTGAMTRGEINQGIARLEARYPEFQQSFADLQDYVGHLNTIERDFHTPQERFWRQQHPDYVPNYRVVEFGIGEGGSQTPTGASGAPANQRTNDFTYRGESHAPYRPWTQTLLERTYNAAQRAMLNDGMLGFVDLVQRSANGGRVLERIPADVIPHNALGELKTVIDQMSKLQKATSPVEMQNLIAAVDNIDPRMYDVKYWQNVGRLTTGQKAENIVMVMRNGLPEFYQVGDNILYDALAGTTKEMNSSIVRALHWHANLLRTGVTLDPGFLFYSNLIRDSFDAFMVSSGGFKPFWDTARGIGMTVKDNPLKEEWTEAGGAMSANAALDRATVRRKVEDLGRTNHPVTKAVDITRDFLQGLRDKSEMANRMATFERELKFIEKKEPDWSHESHVMWAAYRSRDMMDFAMKGRASADITAAIAFSRSHINGLAKMTHETIRDPARIMLHGAPLAVATASLWAMNHKDPDYGALSDWEKDNYWHIKRPNSHEFIRIPKPHGWGLVFGTALEHGFERASGNPHGGDSNIRAVSQNVMMDMPNMVGLALDIASNTQSFSGAPIVPDYMESGQSAVRAEDQARLNTSPLAKVASLGLAKVGVPVSPAILEYAGKQIGGPSADYAGAIADWIAAPFTGETPERSTNPLRRVTTHLNGYPALHQELRDQYDRITRDYNSANLKQTQKGRDNRAQETGYKSYGDLLSRRAALMAGYNETKAMERQFYQAKSDKDRYAIRDAIQSRSLRALNAAGLKYKTPLR